MRHDLVILGALLLLALAIAVPRLLQGQWKGALLGLLALAGAVLGGVALLLGVDWIQQASDRPAQGWPDRAALAVGHLLRFALFGLIGAIVATALAANHGLGAPGEDLATTLAGPAAGLLGTVLYLHLGKARFWPSFRKFALALLGSFLGGLLGLLGPDPWGVDAGILVPLLLFLVLAFLGRVVPRPVEDGTDLPGGP